MADLNKLPQYLDIVKKAPTSFHIVKKILSVRCKENHRRKNALDIPRTIRWQKIEQTCRN